VAARPSAFGYMASRPPSAMAARPPSAVRHATIQKMSHLSVPGAGKFANLAQDGLSECSTAPSSRLPSPLPRSPPLRRAGEQQVGRWAAPALPMRRSSSAGAVVDQAWAEPGAEATPGALGKSTLLRTMGDVVSTKVGSGIRALSATGQKIVRRPAVFKGFLSTRDRHQRRVRALEALVEHLGSGMPLQELLGRLTRDLVIPGGEAAFTNQEVEAATRKALAAAAAPAAETLASGRKAAADAAALVVKAIGFLTDFSELSFDEAFGQLLWRFRRAEPLQMKAYRKVIDDLDWAAEGKLLQSVEEVFRKLTVGKGGRMGGKQWRKVVQFLEANPVIKQRMCNQDAQRLFWYESQLNVTEAPKSISITQFRSVLAQLAECWKMHPYTIFLAVGSHADYIQSAADEDEQPSWQK